MDIRQRIEEIMIANGLQKKDVAEKMGKAKQNFKSLMTNPKWDTIEAVCQAIGIDTWQLFVDEIETKGYRIVKVQDEDQLETSQSETNAQVVEETRLLRFQYDCPQCGKPVKISIEKG
ncbi:MAG: helix-turn-helix transcriptional regulator [Prevotella sp.]|nr:helix-turn-helix transcriptional regulator [Prevotella sp.]